MREHGTVLLVESDAERRERLGRGLQAAGYEVIGCPGPTSPDYTCIGSREGYCPLLEEVDVVVLDRWLAGDDVGAGATSDQLLGLYVATGRPVVTLGRAGGWVKPPAGGHVVYLDEHADEEEVVAAVQRAPDVQGFVLRHPARRRNASVPRNREHEGTA